jgi:hypothetical protein
MLAATPRCPRRSAVVLIMVVAVLAILFVSGAALLTTVTFETKTLDVVREVRENEVMVQSIEQAVSQVMRDGFLNVEGKPYSPASGEVFDRNDPQRRVVLPTYGEVPGIHTWVDLTEPEDDGTVSRVSLYSNFDRARKGQVAIAMPSLANPSVNEYERLFPIVFDQALVNLDESSYETVINRDSLYESNAKPAYIQDADGDGIPDSYAVRIDDGMLPPDIRASIADRLRDPNAPLNPSDPDALWLTLKIVPHGSMVNLNTRIRYCDIPGPPSEYYTDVLVENALGLPDIVWQTMQTNGNLSHSYLPESHEWALRNRGLLLPFNAPQSRLFAELNAELVQPNPRWWQYDQMTVDDYANSTWRQKLSAINWPGGTAQYDRVHLVTTTSHDDNLVRSATVGGVDIIDDISTNGNYAWSAYPDFLPAGDPRKGHLKFSFPYFSKVASNGGWLPDGRTLDTLDQTDTPGNNREKVDLVRLIQDAFFLQLRNHAELGTAFHFNTNGIDPLDSVEVAADNKRLSIIAAALTANLIDFADISDEPTEVLVRDWRTGLPDPAEPNLKVYGLEMQPFITEIMIEVPLIAAGSSVLDELDSAFAIELYNPFDVAIDLSNYVLTDFAPDAVMAQGTAGLLNRFDDVALNGMLAANSFVVFRGYGELPSVSGFTQIGSHDNVMDGQSVIGLQRVVGTERVTVDQVDLTNTKYIKDYQVGIELKPIDLPNLVNLPASLTTDTPKYSFLIQRDTTADKWRFPVPKYKYSSESGDVASEQTLGAPNAWIDTSIRPVQLGSSNTGVLRTSFPTTGTMLLLMRHAHLSDPTLGADVVPFNHVHDLILAEQCELIDNGRMPVFDERFTYHQPSNVDGDIQGVTALPWGQLVFDYFTALPLNTENTPCNDPNLQDLQGYPPVDMKGVRVSGRINLNTAPWSVISGLPLMDMDKFKLPAGLKDKIRATIYPSGSDPRPKAKRHWDDSDIQNIGADQPGEIGREFAQAIVAYREARAVPSTDPVISATVDYAPQRGPYVGGARTNRAGFGFLTVGELLNVRHLNTAGPGEWFYNVDGGVVANGGDYVSAVARMVALGDWVTTKSHVFTVYGTIRGQFYEEYGDAVKRQDTRESLQAVDQKAIRFQSTIDRLPLLFNPRGKPTRIGARTIGQYSDVRSD